MMEKHKCKFCLRSFSNGRALGGHMRSHMMNLPKQTESPPPPPRPPTVQLSFEAESASSLSSYGLRENPKRSFRFTDPNQFIDTGSIILQEDRESETESSKNPTGPRSKRVKKVDPMKNSVQNESVSVLSSSSDITTEEDVAFVLISLSRDNNNNWKTHTQHHDQQHHQHHHEEQEDEQYEQQQVEEDEDEEDEDVDEEEESEDESEEEEEELKPPKKVRGRYKCDTCNKVFRSYQALGGHRASHKKNKQPAESGGDYSISQHHEKINIEKNINVNNNNISEKKIHECPICFREFSSGQALGGHKRTHNIGFGSASTSTATTTMVRTNVEVARSSANVGDSLLDLNLPAPMDENEDEDEEDDDDDDDVSQVEGSAVSDAEFVKPH